MDLRHRQSALPVTALCAWDLGPGACNWGWAIIIVTFFINLCIFPARLAMMRSSLKMMRIQPKIENIKKRYAHLR